MFHCLHSDCRFDWMRAHGDGARADREERNMGVRDWMSNWGKLVYDPSCHGRDKARRKMMADIARAMRKGLPFVDAVRAGAWGGASIGR